MIDKGDSAHGRRSSRRVNMVSLAVSVLIHAVVIIAYSVSAREWEFGVVVPVGQVTANPVEGTRVVRIIELPPDDPVVEAPEELEPEPEPEAPTAPTSVTDSQAPVIEDVPPGVRAADVLQILSADPRLWRVSLPEAFELTDEERMQLELAGRLEAWNDSVRALLASEEAWTDWTTTGENGERWGVSPGKLHLGKLTLPLPFGFSGNAWQRERASRRAFEDADIRNGAAASIMADYWEQRVEAIRLRRERERRREQSDSTKTKPGGDRP